MLALRCLQNPNMDKVATHWSLSCSHRMLAVHCRSRYRSTAIKVVNACSTHLQDDLLGGWYAVGERRSQFEARWCASHFVRHPIRHLVTARGRACSLLVTLDAEATIPPTASRVLMRAKSLGKAVSRLESVRAMLPLTP
jgi:hypothetical protein